MSTWTSRKPPYDYADSPIAAAECQSALILKTDCGDARFPSHMNSRCPARHSVHRHGSRQAPKVGICASVPVARWGMISQNNRAILLAPILPQSTAGSAAYGAAEVDLSLNEVFEPQNVPG